MKLTKIILATAGISEFAERTFSLSRQLKTWLKLGMNDDMFDALGLIAWCNDDVDTMQDLVKVGNEYISN